MPNLLCTLLTVTAPAVSYTLRLVASTIPPFVKFIVIAVLASNAGTAVGGVNTDVPVVVTAVW